MPRTKKTESESTKRAVKKASGLSAPVYSLAGTAAGQLSLPKEVFGAVVNKALLSQALRVYSNNLKGHFGSTKTRGEVEGSTRKIYKQKGTGGARHGARRAPIFVGGGVALGPKFRKINLDLPVKMKKMALISALSQKAKDGEVVAISNLDKASGKTSEMAKLLNKMGKKSALVIVDKDNQAAQRAFRNLKGVENLLAEQLNAYEVVKHQLLVVTKEAVEKLEQKLLKEDK